MFTLPIAAMSAVAIVGLIHVVIAIAEIFLWLKFRLYEKLKLDKRLGLNESAAILAYPIVKNAGLYNGFIAAGLFWATFATPDPFELRAFFLICVIVAGIFGSVTLKGPGAVLLQTVPGVIAFTLAWLAHTS